MNKRLFVLNEYVKGLDREPGFRVFGVTDDEEKAQRLTQGDYKCYTPVEFDVEKGLYLRVENIKIGVGKS